MKLPTHPDAEQSILASIAALAAVRPADALHLVDACRLEADDFSAPERADMFRASCDFLRRGVPLELFSLEAALHASAAVKAKGGRAWLAELLIGKVTPGVTVQEQARLVRTAGVRRRAFRVLQETAHRVLEPDLSPDEAIALGADAWKALATRTALTTAEGDVFRAAEMLDAAQKGRRDLVELTGIAALDEAIGGLQPARLTLVGALPGVGKSALLATIVRNLSSRGRKVGLFSLEDESLWLTFRLLSLESGVPLFLLGTRPLVPTQAVRVDGAGEAVHRTLKNVVIDDRPGLTAAEVSATAADMVLNHGCRVIVVDHLGEIRLDRSERYDLDIADALAQLRDVAKRYDVPVLVASHIRRRQNKGIADPPELTDFANSSAPERMARVALGLSKPSEDVLRVSILKQTNGPSGFDVNLSLVPHAAMVDSEARPSAPRQEASDGE